MGQLPIEITEEGVIYKGFTGESHGPYSGSEKALETLQKWLLGPYSLQKNILPRQGNADEILENIQHQMSKRGLDGEVNYTLPVQTKRETTAVWGEDAIWVQRAGIEKDNILNLIFSELGICPETKVFDNDGTSIMSNKYSGMNLEEVLKTSTSGELLSAAVNTVGSFQQTLNTKYTDSIDSDYGVVQLEEKNYERDQSKYFLSNKEGFEEFWSNASKLHNYLEIMNQGRRSGIMHGDVHCKNLVVNGVVKLIDFEYVGKGLLIEDYVRLIMEGDDIGCDVRDDVYKILERNDELEKAMICYTAMQAGQYYKMKFNDTGESVWIRKLHWARMHFEKNSPEKWIDDLNNVIEFCFKYD